MSFLGARLQAPAAGCAGVCVIPILLGAARSHKDSSRRITALVWRRPAPGPPQEPHNLLS